MFAIIRTGGKQFKIKEDMKIQVPSLSAKVGDEVVFSEVLLLSAGERQYTGSPLIKGAQVRAEVIRHGRDDKVIIYKYRKRKGYHLKQGHRQGFTEVRIKSVRAPGDQVVSEAKEKEEESKRARITEPVKVVT